MGHLRGHGQSLGAGGLRDRIRRASDGSCRGAERGAARLAQGGEGLLPIRARPLHERRGHMVLVTGILAFLVFAAFTGTKVSRMEGIYTKCLEAAKRGRRR